MQIEHDLRHLKKIARHGKRAHSAADLERAVIAHRLDGVGAVKPEGAIDLVVNLEVWDDQKAYDRLGLISETQDILGVTVPSVTIPITPGRNLAVILEVAAMNNRQKRMGYNAAVEFTEQMSRFFEKRDQ